MRALIVTAGFLAVVGVAMAATPKPVTLVHSSSPVEAVTQDGGFLAWLTGNRTTCNAIHILGNSKSFILPQSPNGSLTCRWALAPGAQQLAIAAGAGPAALWTLHQNRSNYVLTAQAGGKEVKVQRLAHQSDGTHLWLGGITGGGTTLAYSWADVEYVDPIACGSGGSCARKVAGGGINLVTAGQKSALAHSGPALDLAVAGGRIAYVKATAVTSTGTPVSTPGAGVQVVDASNGSLVSQAHAAGTAVTVGLSAHVLAVLSHAAGKLKLTWFDPATGAALGGMFLPAKTSLELAVDDQVIVYRVGRFLHAVTVSTGHTRVLLETGVGVVGLSLDNGRLVWAETGRLSGRIRGLAVG